MLILVDKWRFMAMMTLKKLKKLEGNGILCLSMLRSTTTLLSLPSTPIKMLGFIAVTLLMYGLAIILVL